MKLKIIILFIYWGLFQTNAMLFAQLNKRQVVSAPFVYTTTADQIQLFKKQNVSYSVGPLKNTFPTIELKPEKKFQTVEGFGYTLTGGSAYLINKMNPDARFLLLKELFGKEATSIGVSYLRISLGASDLDSDIFSYDDLNNGEIDPELKRFSLSKDTSNLIPILKQILAINSHIKIMATSWSPPVWMKDNHATKGGHLLKEFYGVYAEYFVRYIQEMKKAGIQLDAITIQNEPHHGGNNPSMLMDAYEQASFIKRYLGPAFEKNQLATKIIVWDHNCDEPNYPISVLQDGDANRYIDGSAFHLYNGEVSALSTVHNAFPEKNIYFTEQWTGKNGTFGGDLMWHIKNVIIGTMNNWSKTALEWNLANDIDFGPHTPGGCTQCKGALTIKGSQVTRNVSYYIIAHASKFLPQGSVKIESEKIHNLNHVAFLTPSGKKVLIVLNESDQKEGFNVRLNAKWVSTYMLPKSVSTFVF